ncbi:MAG: nuclear transport factor 2 family protein [Myxococcales bacterium]|nr:nuclear transport factor 2 family protein [Myxococcales bacterium]
MHAELVHAFNACINGADLDGLVEMLTEDHRFEDPAGSVVEGLEACREAWRRFFAAFPGYTNTFDRVVVRGDQVVIAGSSAHDEPALSGPALWSAQVREGRLARWSVHLDIPEERERLGL